MTGDSKSDSGSDGWVPAVRYRKSKQPPEAATVDKSDGTGASLDHAVPSNEDAKETPDATAQLKHEETGPPTGDQDAQTIEAEDDVEGRKRGYKTVMELWSGEEHTWVETKEHPHPTDPSSPPESGYLFVIRKRFHPNDYTGKDYIELISPNLVRPARTLLGDYEMYDERPVVRVESIVKAKFDLVEREKDLQRRIDQLGQTDAARPDHDADATATEVQDEEEEDEEDEDDHRLTSIPELQERLDELKVLNGWITEHFAPTQARLDLMRKHNDVAFDLLWCTFHKGVRCVLSSGNVELGVTVSEIEYVLDDFTGRKTCHITTDYLSWNGAYYRTCQRLTTIPAFKGTKRISTLPIKLLDSRTQEKLADRGRVLVQHAGAPRFLRYNGNGSAAKAGRVMVDSAKANDLVDIGAIQSANGIDWKQEAEDAAKSLAEDQLWSVDPYIKGFNVETKSWIDCFAPALEPIKFDSAAFDHLVLPDETKRLIRGLVEATRGENAGSIMSDVISKKGLGCVFALHGAAGTGKTLTAESIAELLERPLYMVGSGELGTSAGSVERELRSVLDLCERWNAVALIDEADVYLEERSLHELDRNALVSVFLRLLDYNGATLILTSNRVKTFDPAFVSRFNVAIKYPALCQEARAAIWRRFLTTSDIRMGADAAAGNTGVTETQLQDLASKPFNGRTIRNAVRTAQSIALSEQVPFAVEHIYTVISVTEAFKSDFDSGKSVKSLYAAAEE